MNALARKRKHWKSIGYMVTSYLCLRCAPELRARAWSAEMWEDLVEGDDAEVPIACSKCGGTLTPAE